MMPDHFGKFCERWQLAITGALFGYLLGLFLVRQTAMHWRLATVGLVYGMLTTLAFDFIHRRQPTRKWWSLWTYTIYLGLSHGLPPGHAFGKIPHITLAQWHDTTSTTGRLIDAALWYQLALILQLLLP